MFEKANEGTAIIQKDASPNANMHAFAMNPKSCWKQAREPASAYQSEVFVSFHGMLN
jgi:hypothetical protein